MPITGAATLLINLLIHFRIFRVVRLNMHHLDPYHAFYMSAHLTTLRRYFPMVLWNGKAGTWLDYDHSSKTSRNYFYPSNLTPLWTRSYNHSRRDFFAAKAIEYLNKSEVINLTLADPAKFWSVPTSNENNTGEQWDGPNAWAPLQAFVIQGLERTGNAEAEKIARNLAQRWLNSTYTSYKNSSAMYEKYNAKEPGSCGGGGEYEVQKGFGWTNGYLLEILKTYYS